MTIGTKYAFQCFKEFAKGKSFNELLGCAKYNIGSLEIIKDVDDYDNNKIAFSACFYTEESIPCKVEVSYTNNGIEFAVVE